MAKRGLGRGLAALIPSTPRDERPDVQSDGDVNQSVTHQNGGTGRMEVPVDLITPNPYQPRTQIREEELRELAESIRSHGMLQPVVVRTRQGAYQLVAGERRWHAARAAGLERIPVVVRECTDREMLELAIVENLQRADINPLDAARAYRRLADEFALTQDEIAKRVGKSRPSIANTLRLLDLPTDVQQFLSDGKLSEGHARALLMCGTSQAIRILARKIVTSGLSVRRAEQIAQSSSGRKSNRARGSSAEQDPYLRDIQDRLRRFLGTKVHVHSRSEGGGTIEIDFPDSEQLTRILEVLLGPIESR